MRYTPASKTSPCYREKSASGKGVNQRHHFLSLAFKHGKVSLKNDAGVPCKHDWPQFISSKRAFGKPQTFCIASFHLHNGPEDKGAEVHPEGSWALLPMGFSLGAHTEHADQRTVVGTGEFLDLCAVKFHPASPNWNLMQTMLLATRLPFPAERSFSHNLQIKSLFEQITNSILASF